MQPISGTVYPLRTKVNPSIHAQQYLNHEFETVALFGARKLVNDRSEIEQ
jgi:hypothetical protein